MGPRAVCCPVGMAITWFSWYLQVFTLEENSRALIRRLARGAQHSIFNAVVPEQSSTKSRNTTGARLDKDDSVVLPFGPQSFEPNR